MTSRRRALIIEDNYNLAHIYGESARMANYDIEIIQDGFTAANRLQEIIPNVVILDLHLPKVSGTDLLKLIRDDKRLSHTAVIIATADEYLADMLQPMADYVLLKPIFFDELRHTILRTQLWHIDSDRPN